MKDENTEIIFREELKHLNEFLATIPKHATVDAILDLTTEMLVLMKSYENPLVRKAVLSKREELIESVLTLVNPEQVNEVRTKFDRTLIVHQLEDFAERAVDIAENELSHDEFKDLYLNGINIYKRLIAMKYNSAGIESAAKVLLLIDDEHALTATEDLIDRKVFDEALISIQLLEKRESLLPETKVWIKQTKEHCLTRLKS